MSLKNLQLNLPEYPIFTENGIGIIGGSKKTAFHEYCISDSKNQRPLPEHRLYLAIMGLEEGEDLDKALETLNGYYGASIPSEIREFAKKAVGLLNDAGQQQNMEKGRVTQLIQPSFR